VELTGDRLRLVIGERAGAARLTGALCERLASEIADAPRARIVTIEGGAPGAFCEGLDLGAAAEGPADPAALAHFRALLLAIERAGAPVVALVDGPALGGGAGLAAAADLVLASPRASFALPEALLGLVPAVVLPHLARRIGVARARLLALSARPVAAAEALAIGLVDEVADDLEAALARWARRFARTDPRALAAVKTLAAEHFGAPSGYGDDALARFSALLASEPTRARIRAFLAGDAPWSGEA
jgi:enoyl-CoA hydratase/carnithine racemase